MKIRPMGAQLLHVAGQTDMMTLIITLETQLKTPLSSCLQYQRVFV